MSGPIIGEMLRDINSKLGDAREGIFQLHHVILWYDFTSGCFEIKRCWRDLFAQTGRSVELLPTKDALKQLR